MDECEGNLMQTNVCGCEEELSELSLRPKYLNEYIGQTKVKENMKILGLVYVIGVFCGIVIDLVMRLI